VILAWGRNPPRAQVAGEPHYMISAGVTQRASRLLSLVVVQEAFLAEPSTSVRLERALPQEVSEREEEYRCPTDLRPHEWSAAGK
jgi:hypothetical protein